MRLFGAEYAEYLEEYPTDFCQEEVYGPPEYVISDQAREADIVL